jgi:multidrug transporter EmrE-like cation transporter
VLKLARAEVNALGLLTLAYFIACSSAATLWLLNPGLGSNRLEVRDMVTAAALGVSIVGLEFGFVSAFRMGMPINATGTIVNVWVALLVVPVGYFVFREQMSLVNMVGLALCCAGLLLLTQR